MLKRRFYPIIIVAFLLLNISMITPVSQTATASEYQGWGNWVIDDNTTVTGETIVVYGDVIVKDGGSLTLDHCTLKIESIVPGHNGIEVEKGGELYVYNTTITAYQSYQYYTFEVYGKVIIDGADISRMSIWFGLHIYETKDAMIKNSDIHDNGPSSYGITFNNSVGTVIGNDIYKNYGGIATVGFSNVTITGNNIRSNSAFGITCQDNSIVSVEGNVISENLRGLETLGSAKVDIANNSAVLNKS